MAMDLLLTRLLVMAIGYRIFDVEPIFETVFETVNQKKLSQTFRFGLNFGYSFSFDGRR
jgi:hypothetical protein